MTDKIRKRLGPVSVVATIAVLGLLAAFIALAALPDITSAQGPPPPPPPPSGDGPAPPGGDGPPPPPAPPVTPNQLPTINAPAMEPIVIEGTTVDNTATVEGVMGYFSDPDGDDLTFAVGSSNTSVATGMLVDGDLVITAHDAGEADITVTATDPNGGEVSLTIMVVVRLSPAERYELDPASYEFDAPAMTRVTFTVSAVDADGTALDEDATVNLLVTQHPAEETTLPLVTRVIGLDSSLDSNITDDNILQGLLTVRATDPDGERGFTVYFQCFQPGEWVEIEMLDEVPQLVGMASISCTAAAPPEPDPDEITASECYSITGSMDENEAMDQMRDDIEPHTRPAHPTNPEMGQDTIEILEGSADVQITVTSCEAGPVYVRFLDSDGDVFGTDIDECETCEGASGADVVGLDSQQKLELNMGPTEMDAPMALMYDQYNVVTPGDGADKYLVGNAGMYYQGAFRFIAPCDWGPFKVEVYEKNGKVLQELENGMFSQTVSCVPPLQAVANELQVAFDTGDTATGKMTWEVIEGAIGYTVAVIDMTNPAMYTVHGVAMKSADDVLYHEFTGLSDRTRYMFVVYAELPGGTYSGLRVFISTPEFVAS